MLDALLSGVGLGLVLSILIGPVFFLLIKTSIYDGFKSAMFLELGICLSDAVCIYLSYIGLANLLQSPQYKTIISWTGGIILILFGVFTYFNRVKISKKISLPRRDDYWKLIVRGFVFNISNPSVLFFWIGSVGIAVSQFGANDSYVFTYFFCTLLVVISIDILKAKLAMKLAKKLNENSLALLSKVAGIGIAAFGIAVIAKGILKI